MAWVLFRACFFVCLVGWFFISKLSQSFCFSMLPVLFTVKMADLFPAPGQVVYIWSFLELFLFLQRSGRAAFLIR